MANFLASFGKALRPQGTVFFGWYIVASAAGLQLLSGLLWMQSYGAYVVLLQEDFGWSKTMVAGAFALARVESGVLGPLQGWLVDRFGPKIILTIGILLFGIGFVSFSSINSLLGFYLSFALIAVGSSLGGFATVMVSIVNWFHQHRSKAIAVSQIGYSLGGVAVPLLVICLEAIGWRMTAFYSGLVVLLVGLPLAQLVRHRPADYGQVADGQYVVSTTVTSQLQGVDFSARQAMATSAFWLVSVGHASALLCVSVVMVHLVPHLSQGLGFTLTEAALVVALLTGFQMFGQIVGGYLGDRFNKRWLCIACMVVHALALLELAYATEVSEVILFAIMHGLAWGVRGPLMVAIRADYFGPSAFGTIMGFSSLILMFGMSGGPIIAGYMADLYGDYKIGLVSIACAAFLGSFCFVAARKPELRDRELTRQEG
ncbi:MAG TPA: MFS transporter [Gammaproteobacteria bacterium]|nr:MFS transporter [Gammaproteobacteria bacterium]HIK71205.1 MFS transporter [Pseudomonadales bacterium]